MYPALGRRRREDFGRRWHCCRSMCRLERVGEPRNPSYSALCDGYQGGLRPRIADEKLDSRTVAWLV